jgi:hypothetical protein
MVSVGNNFWKHFLIFVTYVFCCLIVLPPRQQPEFEKEKRKRLDAVK